MNSYARALFSKGMHFSILEDIQAAKKLHLEALDVLEKISSVQKHHIIWTKHCIIKCCLLEWNSTKICDDETSFAPQNCISLLTEIIEYQTQFLPPECPRTAESFKLLAEIHLFLKNTNEARVCLEKAIEIWTKGFGEHCSAIKKCKSLLDFLSHKQF
jgi:tetratricopeptide (TPR) repeat protein